MADFFISYAREDRELAAKLAGALERRGHSVWWDSRLIGGDDYTDIIQGEIDKAEAVIVIWSAVSIKKPFVRSEANQGMTARKLIPVRFDDGVRVPMPFDAIQLLSLAQWNGAFDAAEMQAIDNKLARVRAGWGPEDLAGGADGEGGRRRFRGPSIGGIPLVRYLLGALVCALAFAVVSALGQSFSSSPRGFLNTLWVDTLRFWAAFLLVRGLYQIVLNARGKQATHYLDEPFLFWILFSALAAIFGIGVVLFLEGQDAIRRFAEALQIVPVITLAVLFVIGVSRALGVSLRRAFGRL